MYISSVKLYNFRSFKQTTVQFKDGLNVLIGHNNSGKSNLLLALSLIFNRNISKQLTVNDFNKFITLDELKEQSPEITITVTLSQSDNEDLLGDDLVTVSTWLTKLEESYEAQIQYQFFLPEKEEEKYKQILKNAKDELEAWNIIERDFIRMYIHKTYVGDPKNQVIVEQETINKFDFQFLDAIRDVERDMYSGRDTLLKSVIDFFLDYEIKINKELSNEEKEQRLKQERDEFKERSGDIVDVIQRRLNRGKKELLGYTRDIGASFDKYQPDFEGRLSEKDIYSVLELIVKRETGMSLPIENNGLGYNNLIFIALLLSKMQVDSDGDYMGNNAKVFPMLVIEEPEAHLHPTMQHHFIQFLNKNLDEKKVKQAFITTHSTHISSEIDLDNIIVFYKENDETKISYPGKAFEDHSQSKKYVQRFLDATKSNMLFAERIIFVEGMTEQLLIPVFAKYMNQPLEENHVALINVGGRYFDHFLHLFNPHNKFSIRRKISCITDIDPMRKKKAKGASYEKCYPYEVDLDPCNYEYDYNESTYDENDYIRFFTQNENSKTFEYQLALDNPTSDLILSSSISNRDELEKLIQGINKEINLDDFLDILNTSDENKRVKDSIEKAGWNDAEKRKAVFASRYLNSVRKGEHALDLTVKLTENLDENNNVLCIPQYITDAINWVCD